MTDTADWREVTEQTSDPEVVAAARAALTDPDFPADLKPPIAAHLASYDRSGTELQLMALWAIDD